MKVYDRNVEITEEDIEAEKGLSAFATMNYKKDDELLDISVEELLDNYFKISNDEMGYVLGIAKAKDIINLYDNHNDISPLKIDTIIDENLIADIEENNVLDYETILRLME